MEGDRHSFNPANPIQIDPNESLRIPSEFHQRQNHQPPQIPQQSSKLRGLTNKRDHQNVQYSPFINRTPAQYNRGGYITTNNPFMAPPDSPLIHTTGRLSLKSPSLNTLHQMNMNSPYPAQVQVRSSKQPRPVMRRQL